MCWDARVDVIVAGAGPAGWAAADQCARHGLDTTLVDPNPHAAWPATYGLWQDELALLPARTTAIVPSRTRAFARTARRLSRAYAVLDNESVRTAVANPSVRVVTDRVGSATYGGRGCSVVLASGRVLAGAVVIDATGSRRILAGRPIRQSRVEQTAYGLILPEATARPLLAANEALFMDWRPAPGAGRSWPTFHYAVPLPGGRVLLEETSLARRPGLPLAELRRRLHDRLAAQGIPTMSAAIERVRIPVDLPVPRTPTLRGGAIPFGAAAAMVHPASGYSLAEVFRLAPRLAEAIAGSLPHGPVAAVRAARHTLWTPPARTVHLLRRRGLATVLALPPHRLPDFFELFFSLPGELQRAYLSGREDVAGTAAAMAAMFGAAPWSLRATMVRTGVFRGVG